MRHSPAAGAPVHVEEVGAMIRMAATCAACSGLLLIGKVEVRGNIANARTAAVKRRILKDDQSLAVSAQMAPLPGLMGVLDREWEVVAADFGGLRQRDCA